jgi:hypothetical protein
MVIELTKSIRHFEARIRGFLKWAEKEDGFETPEILRLKQKINDDRWSAWEQRFLITEASSEKNWISELNLVSMVEDGPRIIPLIDPEIKAIYWRYIDKSRLHLPPPP